jgi:hypothetical protein
MIQNKKFDTALTPLLKKHPYIYERAANPNHPDNVERQLRNPG